jgi:D-glycero-D-manno-heptose 1,7-bisphosphate phosphatase
MNDVGIFLDRDGTVNEEVDYLTSPEDFTLLPDTARAIHEANSLDWKVFIITNQSGIARGLLTQRQLETIHETLRTHLRTEDAILDAIYFCPHHPDIDQRCMCRKPQIGMLLQAQQEFRIDLKHSYVVGDKMIDIETARNASAKGILVLTGYGKSELMRCKENDLKIDFVAENLYDAIQYIKRNEANTTHLSHNSR